MVVSMGSIAASGGYYISMAVGDQEQSIYAEPTTTTGSIGVIIPHYDLSGLLARFDVKDDSIKSHPRKQMLSMTRPLNEEHRKLLQEYVDESLVMFKDRVREGRPGLRQKTSLLDEVATGEIFSALKAQQRGLVDEIGFIEDAIDRAIELAGLEKDEVRVVRYKRPPSLLDLAGFAHAQPGGFDLSALLELNTPRAWFLASTLPPLVESRDDEN
jgi:protease-4